MTSGSSAAQDRRYWGGGGGGGEEQASTLVWAFKWLNIYVNPVMDLIKDHNFLFSNPVPC